MIETSLKLIQRTVTLHDNRLISIMIPSTQSMNITAVDDGRGDYLLLSNGNGYAFLSKLFAIAANLEKGEIIYLPFEKVVNDELKNKFSAGFFSGMVILNYCSTQIKIRDILDALKTKIFVENHITRTCNIPENYIERWKIRDKLTVKKHSKLLVISTNGEELYHLSTSSSRFPNYEDDTSNNLIVHQHHDCEENTSKSLGINFYYWHNG